MRRQRDGRVAVTAFVPLGRLDATTLGELAALAGEVRLSTARTVTVPDVVPADAESVTRALGELGLSLPLVSGWVEPDGVRRARRMRRRRVSTCARGRAPRARRSATPVRRPSTGRPASAAAESARRSRSDRAGG